MNENCAVQGGVVGMGGSLANVLDNLVSFTGGSENESFDFFDNFSEIVPDLFKVFLSLSSQGTVWGALGNILLVGCFFAAGYGAETLFSRKLIQRNFQFGSNGKGGKTIDTGGQVLHNLEKFNSTLTTFLPEFIGLLAFPVVSFAAYSICIPADFQPLKLFFLATLMTIGLKRGYMFISHIVFSPYIDVAQKDGL